MLPLSIGILSEWELEVDEEGIKVYTKSVSGSSLKAFKGITEMNYSLNQVKSVIENVAQSIEWLPDCEQVRLEYRDGNKWVQYVESYAPFPVSNRDGYYQYVKSETDQSIRIVIHAVPEYKPEIDGIVRIPKADGFWLLEKISSNRTKVVYQFHADPGGNVPGWLANSTVTETPFETLQNLREYLEDKYD